MVVASRRAADVTGKDLEEVADPKNKSRARVIVLGAGRAGKGNLPTALVTINDNQRVLDWILASFSPLQEPACYFVGGYLAGAIASRYPNIRFFFNPDWATTGPARSLSLAPLATDAATYIAYSDVLFRPSAVERLHSVQADIVVTVDSEWRSRYEGRSQSDLDGAEKIQLSGTQVLDIGKHIPINTASAEFCGLMKLSPDAARQLKGAIGSDTLGPRAGLPEVIRPLLQAGLTCAAVDVQGDWAELNAPQDLARFVLGTKAESLERLRPLLKSGEICGQVRFTHLEWKCDPRQVILAIQAAFEGISLIVRSSALSEDGWQESAAGAHRSVLDVPSDDAAAVRTAVEEVIAAYRPAHNGNQVLVQPMLKDVVMSGVVMTRTPTLGAPYLIINYDLTDQTDTVTSGAGKNVRTLFLHRGDCLPPGRYGQLSRIIQIVEETEGLVGHDSLDIEFALTADQVGHLLQVRPIAVAHRDLPIDDERISAALRSAVLRFGELGKAHPFLLGSSTQFSVMADWNPAEMIGTKPHRLAFSLYRYLITDETWALQRSQYGYRDVRPANLIVDFLGHPYVDMRVDFNSFLPASLPRKLAGRLVDHYLEVLRARPELHDKVEFEVLHTYLSFDFDRRASGLKQAGFTDCETGTLRDALLAITRRAVARCEDDLNSLEHSRLRQQAVEACELDLLEQAFLYLEDVRTNGAVIFSHLARHAFVAVTMLRSLVAAGLLSQTDVERFLSSLSTIPTKMQGDARRVDAGEMIWEEFVAQYGHLRPGSYDITSPRYASAPEQYLVPALQAVSAQNAEPFCWDEETLATVGGALTSSGLGIGTQEFLAFAKRAIEGREFGKFTFMRNVNAALEALAEFGDQNGISREDLAHVKIQSLLALRAANTSGVHDILQRLVSEGKEAFEVTQAVCLPGQIFEESDFVHFELRKAEPNFVTQRKVVAELLAVRGPISTATDVEGKIVMLVSADPGFDWLFSKKIAALITMYGGLNSHMTIRASELRIPAAIGIGELLYEELNAARVIELDCASRQIRIVV